MKRRAKRSLLERGIVVVRWSRRYEFPRQCVACGAPATESRNILLTDQVTSIGFSQLGRTGIDLDGVPYCGDHAPKVRDGHAVQGWGWGLYPGIKALKWGWETAGMQLENVWLLVRFSRPEYARLFAAANIDAIAGALTTDRKPDAQQLLEELR